MDIDEKLKQICDPVVRMVHRGLWRGLEVAVKTVTFQDRATGAHPHCRLAMKRSLHSWHLDLFTAPRHDVDWHCC
jgi:hypothetical protein